MWKRFISAVIILLPLILWEFSLRPNSTIPFHSERDTRLVKDIINDSRYLFGGNSMVGALPREAMFVDSATGKNESGFINPAESNLI